MSRARMLATSVAIVTLASPPPALAQADGAAWSFSSYVAEGAVVTTFVFTFGVPETDAVAFTASCEGGTPGPNIPVMLSVDFGDTPDGTPTLAVVQSGAAQASYPAAVRIESDESAGLLMEVAPDDPFWSVFNEDDPTLAFAMLDRVPTTVPLAGSNESAALFLQACRTEFAAAQAEAAGVNLAFDYSCADGTTFRAEFDNSGADSVATLTLAGGLVRLTQQPSGSGALYAADGITLHTKADEAVFGQAGKPDTTCKAVQ